MDKFTKEQLYNIYGKFLMKFTELAQLANKHKVYLEVDVSPDGDIEFKSREYFFKNGKSCVTAHEIRQGRNYVNENSRTIVLHDPKEEKNGND